MQRRISWIIGEGYPYTTVRRCKFGHQWGEVSFWQRLLLSSNPTGESWVIILIIKDAAVSNNYFPTHSIIITIVDHASYFMLLIPHVSICKSSVQYVWVTLTHGYIDLSSSSCLNVRRTTCRLKLKTTTRKPSAFSPLEYRLMVGTILILISFLQSVQ